MPRIASLGSRYDHTFTWGGGLLFRSTWTGSGNGTTPWPAWQSLFVSGKALLSNDATCVSGNPTDLEYIY